VTAVAPGRRPALHPEANRDSVALVTGSGTGIGRATALAFARTGAAVILTGRREEPLQQVAAEVEAHGARCLVHPTDLREPDGVDALVTVALDAFGRVDVLVNNAGGQFSAPAETISANGWRAVMRLSLDATWEVTRTVAARSMLPRRSGVVVFLGFSPMRGIPGFVHACAARAAVANLASGLALEWSRYGVRSVCVAPGVIATPAIRGYGEDAVARWQRGVPLGRLGDPDDVAEAVAFLASDGAAYVTGSTLTVDGGIDAWGLAEPPVTPELAT
jgi:citronellol/citronellal dehydrogenase